MSSLFPASVLALLSYYTTLLSTPSPRISLLVAISDAPRLLATYKVLKWVLRVLLRQGSEVERVLDHSPKDEGRIQLQEDAEVDESRAEDDDEVELIQEVQKGQSGTVNVDNKAVMSWRLDYAIAHSRCLKAQRTLLLASTTSSPNALQDLSTQVAVVKRIATTSLSYPVLHETLSKLHQVHLASEHLIARSQQVYSKTNATDVSKLRELWTLLQSDGLELPQDMQSKQWQDLGFQGKDPSTDWRSVGMLGLDSLLYFAQTFKKDDLAQRTVVEAVKGNGENQLGWYPFALASITITDFALRLLKLNSLSWFLLSSSNSVEDISINVETTFHHIVSLLLLHFHQHWMYLQTSEKPQEANRARPVVLDFERVVKVWRVEVARWVERGKIAGWVDSRGMVELDWQLGIGERMRRTSSREQNAEVPTSHALVEL